ncbi:DUF2975 domain-containing protein [Enterobacter sp. UPMP2060]
MITDRFALHSQKMASFTLCFIIAMLLLNAASWLYPTLNSVKEGYGIGFGLTDQLISSHDINLSTFPWWQKVGSILLSSVPLLTLAVGLWHLRLLFQCYGRKEYFLASTSKHLGKVGKSVALWVILKLLCEPFLSAWSTMHEPAGHRVVTLTFGTSDIIALFLAACIAIIAKILEKAVVLDSENRQYV